VPGFKLIKPHSIEAYKNAAKFKPCCPQEGKQTVPSQGANHTGQPQTHTNQVLITDRTQHAGWIDSSGTSNNTTGQHKRLGARHQRWRRVGVGEKCLRHEDQLVHHPAAFSILKRPPQLQRKNNFENAVSRLPREFSLNSKLVTSSLDCPALSRKEGPHCPLGLGI
jgi:hypothetical protein